MATAVVERPLSVSSGLLPTTETSASWRLAELAPLELFRTGQNPETDGQKLQKEKLDIYWPQFADWAFANPIEIQKAATQHLSDYANQRSFLNRLYKYVQTDEDRYFWDSIEVKIQAPPIGTMKVQGPAIGSTSEHFMTRATWTQLACQVDYYAYKKPLGKEIFDIQMNTIASGMWAFLTQRAVEALTGTPQSARRPTQLYPNRTIPTTVEEVMRREQQTFGAMNKGVGAWWSSVRDANTILTAKGADLRVTDVLMGRADIYYLGKCNELNVRVDYGGNGVITTRDDINLPGSIGGVNVLTVPFIDTRLHNEYDETALMRVVTLGSAAPFDDTTFRTVDPKDYLSHYRDIDYCSVRTNTFDRYPYIEFLEALPRFHHLNHPDAALAGYVNYEHMGRFLKEASRQAGADVFTRVGTRRRGNELDLDPLARAVDARHAAAAAGATAARAPDAWYPVVLIGELAESSARSEYLERVYASFDHALHGDLTDREREAWEAALGAAVDPARADMAAVTAFFFGAAGVNPEMPLLDEPFFKAALDKVVRRLADCTFEHPMLGLLRDRVQKAARGAGAVLASEATQTATPWPTRVPAWARVFLNMVEFIRHHRSEYDVYGGAVSTRNGVRAFTPGARTLETAVAEAGKQKSAIPPGLPPWLAHLKQSPAIVPDRENEMGVLPRRLLRTFNLPPLEMFAAQVALWTPLRLQGLRRMTNEHVVIPLGGMNLRPAERQYMHSQYALALARGTLGTLFHSGFDTLVQFSPDHKQFYVEVGMQQGFAVQKRDQFCTIPFSRGGAWIGGSDNLYAEQRVFLGGGSSVTDFLNSLVRGGSNLAVLTSWNDAIEGRTPAVLDARGRFMARDWVTRLETSMDFSNNRQDFMFSGVAYLNYLTNFDRYEGPLADLDYDKFSFNQLALSRMSNFVCARPTVRYFDAQAGSQRRCSESLHSWGPQMPGLRELVTSARSVALDETPSATARWAKRQRLT